VPAAHPAAETAQPITGWAARLAILAVGSALLMQFIDQTALTTALPTIARSLHTSPVHLKLALTAYMLVQAIIVPASGWAADRWGARRVFMVAMATFLAGSLLCGLSHSLGALVAFRMVQGVGAAMMTPVGRMIVVGATPRENLVKAMILFTTPAVIGPILGPPLTGFLLRVADWPWIFWINLPVGILGMAAVAVFVPRLARTEPGRFDYLGFLLASTAIFSAMTVTETLGFNIVGWPVQVALGLVALAAGVLFVRHARRRDNPILDLSLLNIDSFRGSLVGGIFVRVSFGAMPFLMPLLLQIGLGWSPLRAGSVMVSSAVGALLVRLVAPTVIRVFGFRTALMTGAGVYGVLCIAPPLFRPDTPFPIVAGFLLVSGVFGSGTFTALNTVAYADTDQAAVSRAATLYAVVQQIALSMGITVAAFLLQMARSGGLQLTPTSFLPAFAVMGLISLASLLVFRRLTPDVGAQLRGERRRRAPEARNQELAEQL
jgi:EmrB/QacA subfamily drug resistance transporter